MNEWKSCSICENGDLVSFLILFSAGIYPLPFKAIVPLLGGQLKLPNCFAFKKNIEHWYQKGLQRYKLVSSVDKQKKQRAVTSSVNIRLRIQVSWLTDSQNPSPSNLFPGISTYWVGQPIFVLFYMKP